MKQNVKARGDAKQGMFSHYDIANAIDVTANTGGTTTAIIPDTAKVVNTIGVTGSATFIIVLPTPTPGKTLLLINEPFAFELESDTPASVKINNVSGTTSLEIAAAKIVECICVDSLNWIAVINDYDVPN